MCIRDRFKAEDFKAMKFRNIGPAGMSGRITAIDVDLSNPNRIYAGAASGGVWPVSYTHLTSTIKII